MCCTLCYNENNLFVCMLYGRGLQSAASDLFLKDKIGNTAAVGGVAIKSYAYGIASQSASSSRDSVDGIDATSEISFIPLSNLLNQGTIGYACIKLNITTFNIYGMQSKI